MTINEVILSVAKSLKARVHEDYIIIAIRSSEGYSLAKAKTIIGWARQVNASRSPNQSTGCCL
jgi:hypothetical protein